MFIKSPFEKLAAWAAGHGEAGRRVRLLVALASALYLLLGLAFQVQLALSNGASVQHAAELDEALVEGEQEVDPATFGEHKLVKQGVWFCVAHPEVYATCGLDWQSPTPRPHGAKGRALFKVLGLVTGPFEIEVSKLGDRHMAGIATCSEQGGLISRYPAVVVLHRDNSVRVVVSRDPRYVKLQHDYTFRAERKGHWGLTEWVALVFAVVAVGGIAWVARGYEAPSAQVKSPAASTVSA